MDLLPFRLAYSNDGRVLLAILSAAQNAGICVESYFEHKTEHKNMRQREDLMMPRPVGDSQSEMNEIVLPNDTNPLGALLGGRLMHWIDLAGAMAAHRHSRNYVVTAAIDHLDFWTPVHVGDLVILRSSVNRVFNTSMEVGVKVWVENYLLDQCQHVSSAYLTFVAVDGGGRHVPVPAVIPETDEQRRRYEDAGRRRETHHDELERRRSSQN
jgi:acyl-CoA hydrolase